jgi:hypothetical protein
MISAHNYKIAYYATRADAVCPQYLFENKWEITDECELIFCNLKKTDK